MGSKIVYLEKKAIISFYKSCSASQKTVCIVLTIFMFTFTNRNKRQNLSEFALQKGVVSDEEGLVPGTTPPVTLRAVN